MFWRNSPTLQPQAMQVWLHTMIMYLRFFLGVLRWWLLQHPLS